MEILFHDIHPVLYYNYGSSGVDGECGGISIHGRIHK